MRRLMRSNVRLRRDGKHRKPTGRLVLHRLEPVLNRGRKRATRESRSPKPEISAGPLHLIPPAETRMPTYIGMPEQDYRANQAVANSDLKVIKRSPAHFIARRNQQLAKVEKDTPATIAGKALHCAILEPHLFSQNYGVLPGDAPAKPNSRQINAKNPSIETINAINWWRAWEESHPGMTIITLDQYDEFMRTAESVRSQSTIRGYLEAEGDQETSVFAVDPETGVPVKCRTDIRRMIGSSRICLDLKSTDDARPETFNRIAWNFGYFQGAAFYTDVQEWAGEPIDLFLIIAFEREAPYGCKLYELNADDVQRGRDQYRSALDLYAHCHKHNDWPCYSDDIEVLSAPAWAK
jgi:hypothetical protein